MILNSIFNAQNIKPFAKQIVHNSNPIYFKGMPNDSFEKTQTEITEEYLEKLKNDSSTAFLYDDRLTYEEKMQVLKNHPTLWQSKDITHQVGYHATEWYNPKCFVTKEYTRENLRGQKTIKKIFDMTDPLNKENFERLMSLNKKAIDSSTFRIRMNMSVDMFERYLKEGHLRKVTLKTKTGEEANINLINPKDEINIQGINRLRSLSPIRTEIYQTMLTCANRGSLYVSAKELEKYGFGTEKELIEKLKDDQLRGKVQRIHTEGGEKIVTLIDVNNERSQHILRSMRNQRCVSIIELAQKSGVPIKKLEEAVLNGEMTLIREKVFLGDDECLIDTKNPQNIQTFDKLIFERNIERALKKANDIKETQEKKVANSLKMKIAWQLCPQTKRAANRLFRENEQIAEIMHKKQAIEEAIKNSNEDEDIQENLKLSLSCLEKEEEIALRQFFKAMWTLSGTEEFSQALKQANALIKQFKTQGIESIHDENIRNIIIRTHQG